MACLARARFARLAGKAVRMRKNGTRSVPSTLPPHHLPAARSRNCPRLLHLIPPGFAGGRLGTRIAIAGFVAEGVLVEPSADARVETAHSVQLQGGLAGVLTASPVIALCIGRFGQIGRAHV